MMKMMLLIMMPMILLIMPKIKMLHMILMILILIFRLIGLRRRGRDTWKRCRRSIPTTWMRWCILRKKKFKIFKIFTLKNRFGFLGSATFRFLRGAKSQPKNFLLLIHKSVITTVSEWQESIQKWMGGGEILTVN